MSTSFFICHGFPQMRKATFVAKAVHGLVCAATSFFCRQRSFASFICEQSCKGLGKHIFEEPDMLLLHTYRYV